MIHETRHAQGEIIPPHRHALAYAALVLEGEYEECGPDGIWRLAPGDLVIHPPFHLHRNRFPHGAAHVFNLTLSHASARRLGAHSYAIVGARDPDRLVGAATRNAEDALAAALGEGAPRSANAGSWLDRFAEALAKKPNARIAALAASFGVAKEHASRAFTRRFGMTPAAFRAEQRLRLALRALADPKGTLAEIAQRCFYADQAHLTRALVAATGATPARLRAALG